MDSPEIEQTFTAAGGVCSPETGRAGVAVLRREVAVAELRGLCSAAELDAMGIERVAK